MSMLLCVRYTVCMLICKLNYEHVSIYAKLLALALNWEHVTVCTKLQAYWSVC